MTFYESNDSVAWESALDQYPARLEGLGKERLVELDNFYRINLVEILNERGDQAYISRDGLVRIVDWKLTRGKWRPRLLGYAKEADESTVVETSKRAFAALPDLQASIKILSEMKGIGPATASAVLAAYRPNLAPFMSDEALSAALGGVKDYTPKKYAELAEALAAKAKLLGSKSTGEPWTPSDVERAIWSEDAKGRQKEPKDTSSEKRAKTGAAGKQAGDSNAKAAEKESKLEEVEDTKKDAGSKAKTKGATRESKRKDGGEEGARRSVRTKR